MTCPKCGYGWDSHARSQKSRCGRCKATVYVPARVRNAPTSDAPRAPAREAPTVQAPRPPRTVETFTVQLPCCGITARVRVPVPTDDDGWADVLTTRVECTCGAVHELGDVVVLDDDEHVPTEPHRPRPYTSATGATPRAPEPVVSVVAIGAAGRWSCGHEARIATATTSRDPARSRCRTCGTVGLTHQLTPEGWARIATS